VLVFTRQGDVNGGSHRLEKACWKFVVGEQLNTTEEQKPKMLHGF